MIRLANEQDKENWNRFVDSDPQGTFFHLYEWKDIINNVFKHKTYYLIAEQDKEIVGVLPLTHVKSWLFGNNLVSNPFCVYGGAIGKSQTIIDALLQESVNLAKKLNVGSLELRNREQLLNSEEMQWHTKDLYCTFIRPLSDKHEDNLNAIPRKQRAVIRKGIKNGLQYTIDQNPDRFFLAYETSVRNLGTPVFSRRYFKALLETFGSKCDILTVTYHDEMVASVLNFYYKDHVLPFYGGGTSEARRLGANDFMYWSLMEHSVNRGVKFFDFGRSKVGTGSYNFKRYWGFEPMPLYYQYYLNNDKTIPEVNPTNPKYQIFIKAWKKMPLGITRWIGPMLSRSLG